MDVREDSFNTGECSEKGYCHMEEDHEEQCGKGKECVRLSQLTSTQSYLTDYIVTYRLR